MVKSTNYVLLPSRPFDADLIVSRLRQEDINEWVASGSSVQRLRADLKYSIEQSVEPFTIQSLVDGLPVAIFGAIPEADEPDVGKVWLVATPAAERDGNALMLAFSGVSKQVFKPFGAVMCFADARNPVHHRWLEWFGFEKIRTVPYGPWSMPFYEYWRQA